MAIYSWAVDLPMPATAWLFTVLAPVVVSTPVSFFLVRQAERVRRLNADLQLAYERLSQLASTDHLTGLANRRAFLEAASAKRCPGAWLMLADIDHFKSVNDRFGHERGDAFLQAVAEILRDLAGPDDVAGRLGGEEFTLLLVAATQAEAVQKADMLRKRLAAIALPSDIGQTVSTTVSIGLTACREGDFQNDIKQADAALYRAKGRGRNQVEIADPPKDGKDRRALAIAS